MTTPTLEKAAAVIEKIERDGYRFLDHLSGYDESTLIAYIAAAIREAEDVALELACAAVSGAILRSIKFLTDHEPVAQAACDAIRSLKHPKD